MQRRLGFTLAVAVSALVGACGNKPAEAPAASTVAAASSANGAPAVACAEHEGASDEANCPFPDNEPKAAGMAGMEGCGEHMGGAAQKTATGTHFGSAFALTEAEPLAKALEGATDGQALNVRVSGQIDKVCQKMGCWMVIKDGPFEARVIMKDHAFTVPKDSSGKPAQVEGVLKVRVFSEAQAKHLAEDGGEDPAKVQGEKKELLVTATAVEIGG